MNLQRFKDLVERFLVRTAEDVSLLQAQHSAAQTGDRSALSAMQQLAHRINGSSAMLGFKSISAAAAHIESMLRQHDMSGESVDWQALQQAMHALEQSLLSQQTENAHDGKRDDV